MDVDWQTSLERGILQYQRNQKEAAFASFIAVHKSQPNQPEASYYLALLARDKGNYRQELIHWENYSKANPHDINALKRQVGLMGFTGQSNCIPTFCRQYLRGDAERKAKFETYSPALQAQIQSHDIYFHAKLISYMYSQYTVSDTLLFEQLNRWADLHIPPSTAVFPPPNPAPRPLRIGYLSNEFDNHSPIQILKPLLENHQHQDFEIHAFSDVREPDQQTRDIQACVDVWHEIAHLDNQALTTFIRQQQIHILVDLGGLNHRERLPVFGLRAAPVQMTGLGFLFVTGIPNMDYAFLDSHLFVPELTGHYRERPAFLTSLFHWHPRPAHPIGALPRLNNGFITFGCANSLNKYTPELLDTWADILHALPLAQLRFKTPALTDSQTRIWLKDAFQHRGISAQRLIFPRPKFDPFSNHLSEFYNRIDIALDTFPYTGAITTCDALWMGVPVVTLAEEQHRSRAISASILQQLGLTGWIAQNRELYLKIAVKLAESTLELMSARQALRDRLFYSPICDGPAFAREVESTYQKVWAQHVRRVQ